MIVKNKNKTLGIFICAVVWAKSSTSFTNELRVSSEFSGQNTNESNRCASPAPNRFVLDEFTPVTFAVVVLMRGGNDFDGKLLSANYFAWSRKRIPTRTDGSEFEFVK